MNTIQLDPATRNAAQRMQALQRTLEPLIDEYNLDTVLSAIREICYDKANHIAVECQDVALAKQWLAYGVRVNGVAQAINRNEG